MAVVSGVTFLAEIQQFMSEFQIAEMMRAADILGKDGNGFCGV